MIINNAGSRCDVDFWTKHLTNEEENDRAELREIRGLDADNLNAALLEMQEQARILPRLENFMYHADFNPRDHERLSEQEWDRVFEIFEQERGITSGTPRVVYEHEKHGRIHRHVIWLRVDFENMRAFPDGLDWKVAHQAARKIELELGLERVIGPLDREPGTPRPPRAPEPWEMYRGMKTGLDPRDITAEVTELYRQSDSGPAFKTALELHGYELVTGRRGLLILDSAGKDHSLVKRIEGVNKKELDAFMQDVDRENLPTVEQAKEKFQDRKIEGLEADRATVGDEIEWAEALDKSAIAREERERRFVEPGLQKEPERETQVGGRERDFVEFTVQQLLAEQEKAQREQVTEFATEYNDPAPASKGVASKIGFMAQYSASTRALLSALDDHGISLARVTGDEADQSYRQAAFAHAVDNAAPVYREGEIIAVTLRGSIHRLTERTTGQPQKRLEKYFSALEYEPLKGLEEIKASMSERAAELGEKISAERMERATNTGGHFPSKWGGKAKLPPLFKTVRAAQSIVGGAAVKAIDVVANFVGGLLDIFFPEVPKTREQAGAIREDQQRSAYFASVEMEAEQDRQRKRELERD